MKECHLKSAKEIFKDTGVHVTTDGKVYLGSFIGPDHMKDVFVQGKVDSWLAELEELSSIAVTQPHAAFCAFTHGVVNKWRYLFRTTGQINDSLQPLEEAIRYKFARAVTGRPAFSENEQDMLSLPAKMGGLDLCNPKESAQGEYMNSCIATAPLVQAASRQERAQMHECSAEATTIRNDLKAQKRKCLKEKAEAVRNKASDNMKLAMDLAKEKGASSRLSVLPIDEFGFFLHKGAFRDAVSLRYGWQLPNLPRVCVCGKNQSVDHAFTCPTGGLPTLRHNDIRDLTADLMAEVCNNVCTEPELQPLSGEALQGRSVNCQDGARVDIRAEGFWERSQSAFFDIRVFNPFAPSNRSRSLSVTYQQHERLKRRAYEQRIREVEHGSFTPIVLSATGGMGNAAQVTFKRMVSMLAVKRDQPYSQVMNVVRCMLNFSLLKSQIRCIRGSRSSMGHAVKTPTCMIASEGRVPSI